MKRALILLAFPVAAFAQAPTPEEVNDRIQAIAQQRNEQLDRVAILTAELAKMQRALEAAKKAAEARKTEGEKK